MAKKLALKPNCLHDLYFDVEFMYQKNEWVCIYATQNDQNNKVELLLYRKNTEGVFTELCILDKIRHKRYV